MQATIPAFIVAICVLAFFKAESVGKGLKKIDSGALQRMNDLSGDARAYSFYVRMVSIMAGAFCLAFLALRLAHPR